MDVNKVATELIANQSQIQQVQTKERQHSLDLIFTLTKEVLEAQLEQATKLDSKADAMQVSATALLGAALVLEAVLIPLNAAFIIRIIQAALLLPLLSVHAVVVTSASRAYEVSNYQEIANPRALMTKYLKAPVTMTKKRLLNIMVNAYEENEKIIDKKVKLISRAHTLRNIEAAILVVVLLIQVISVLFIHGSI